MDWSDVAALISVAVSVALAWYVIKGQRSGFKGRKEEAADRAAVVTYEWYDGSITSAIKMVEWLRSQLESERQRCERLSELLDTEREARRAALMKEREARREEVHAARNEWQAMNAEYERRIAVLQKQVSKMKAGL